MSLGTIYSPTVPMGGLQVTNFDCCLHILMAIGKCTVVFRGIFLVWRGGGGEVEVGYVGGSFHGGICHGESFNEGGLGPSNII